jgi:hypothetical protein
MFIIQYMHGNKQTQPWVVPLKPPQGVVKEQKMVKSFLWVFCVNYFHNYYFFFMFIQHMPWYMVEVYFGIKNRQLKKNCVPNSDGPFRNHTPNFGNS